MATKFTPHQQQAIDDDHQNILVSASAGSGKTSVLVERVIQKILRGESIDELLVVTFTDAAAKGMRDRIARAIRKAIASSTDAKLKNRLRSQINRLAVADISTLHSFCLHLIKQYYYVIDLDPQFRLLVDQTERELLRESVWQAVREQFYATNDELFEQLTQNFSNDRSDEGLTEVVYRVDEFSKATPDQDLWLAKLERNYTLDADNFVDTTVYTKMIRPILEGVVEQAKADYQAAINLADGDALGKARQVLESEQSQLTWLTTFFDNSSWDDLRQQFQDLSFGRLVTPKDEDAAVAFAPIKELREGAKKQLQSLVTTYFLQDETSIKKVTRETQTLMGKLREVTQAFQQAFANEKRRRHVLDFGDLEHFALKILSNESVEGRAVRQQLQNHYHEVMVDEYQDTNQLQESILQRLVSQQPGNMFMVGDVKQSIYRFRLADPTLFMGKYDHYRVTEQQDGEAIVLAENFRSVKNVTDFTNLVFEQLMDYRAGEMDYDDDAHLKFGATDYDSDQDIPTEIMLYESTVDEADDATEIPDDKATGEVVMVANRIQRLVEQQETILDRQSGKARPIQYGDIAILAPTRARNNLIVEQFGARGIPVTVNDAQNYFQATEIRIMMSLLRIIDNPYQDIPLVAVLRSPIVQLDENELAYLRIQDRTDQYYGAVTSFVTRNINPDDQFGTQLQAKIVKFLEQLDQFKDIARQNRLVDLIWAIYEETGLLNYVGGMPGGKQRQANLHALYNRAYDYEQTSFKGVFEFVRFIDQMQKRDQDLAEAQTESDSNTVTVTTIHGSKGLEYPVVILMNATHKFNKDSIQKAGFVLDLEEGIGVTYLDADRVQIDTVQKQALKEVLNQHDQAEQMRLLYVALTRAEQRLIVTGTYQDVTRAIQSWERAFQTTDIVLPVQPRMKATNFMDWIGMALVRHPGFDQSLLMNDVPWYGLGNDGTKFTVKIVRPSELGLGGAPFALPNDVSESDQLDPDLSSEQQKLINSIMDFRYAYTAATQTTAYQSVSEIKRLFDDPDNHELIQLDFEHAMTRGSYAAREMGQPKFMQSLTKPSPTALGTATHLVLQQLDLAQPPTLSAVNQVIQQLTVGHVLDENVAEQINREAIVDFFASEFGQSVIANADSLHREMPFSLLLQGSQLFKDLQNTNEDILIHGIIDGYFITDEGVTLFDYKTDAVHDDQSLETVVQRYRGQVNLYAEALSQIENAPVMHKYLYLLAVNRLVEV